MPQKTTGLLGKSKSPAFSMNRRASLSVTNIRSILISAYFATIKDCSSLNVLLSGCIWHLGFRYKFQNRYPHVVALWIFPCLGYRSSLGTDGRS